MRFSSLPIIYLLLFVLIGLGACKKQNPDLHKQVCDGWFSVEPASYNTDSVSVFCPTAITPQGYGEKVNEKFYLLLSGIDHGEIRIFLHDIEVYRSTDLKDGWDGKYRGQALPGKYRYQAQLFTSGGQELTLTGEFRILDILQPVERCEECIFADQIVLPRGVVNPTAENVRCP